MKLSPSLPSQPFYGSIDQRLALARERFFGEGRMPVGLVSNAIIQSWTRCIVAGMSTTQAGSIDTVSKNRLESALRRSRRLRDAAAPELERLRTALSNSPCAVLVTDAEGVVVMASDSPSTHRGALIKRVARVGVDMSEPALGTTAPGIALWTGQASVVQGREHYLDQSAQMRCAAAPMLDTRGKLVGVLNVSIEERPFGFDPSEIVGLFAIAIQNRLWRMVALDHLVVTLQVHRELLETAFEGLVGVDPTGRVTWRNQIAAAICGDALEADAEKLLGIRLEQLVGMSHKEELSSHTLPNGLVVWARVARREGGSSQVDTTSPIETLNRPDVPTMEDVRNEFVLRALSQSDGNITAVAKKLSVSRGYVYRVLRRSGAR
jgi:sigma-54 dependent transcriptional regulator, acetoin dehydrogenase operon transcriptional activator AcoR